MGKDGKGGGNIKSALHAIARAESMSVHEIPFDDVPPELMCNPKLDFRIWSMIVSDKTAEGIGREARAREQRFVDKAMADMPVPHQMPADDIKPTDASASAAALSDARRRARQEAYEVQMKKADEDARAASLLRAHDETGVREVLLGGATRLTDGGVAAIAAASPMLESLDLSGAMRVTDVSLRVIAMNCSNLRSFNVGGCAGLCGAGLAAIGSQCKKLETVRLAGCGRAATGWALHALVTGCGESLTSLDLSHCALLTDADCGAVAKHCRGLIRLDLSHCRQTGDQAAVNVSEHCHRIEYLNMARSELLHKTSDVALLSIAEGCGKTLTELDLCGCEMVTDVGVSWVAHQAGATLEKFLLRGCNRITNAGCRAIADHCQVISHIDLRGARRVTDVGVRVLGQTLGDTLETLDISSMHLVTDGVDRGFGFEGLLALAQDVQRLTSLHLDGCFQVSNRSLNALAKGCKTLRELGLAGCPRLTANGIGNLCAASSGTLEKVNLGCCGDCVDDELVVALAKGAPMLKQLFLRDCERWGQVGARAIARHCRRLHRLDCTGCTSLDDEGVAQLAETHWKYPGLRHLLLAHCPKFGDIGLAWLVEGPGSKALVTLSLYRCSCTSAALKSSRDHFPHSEMKRDNGFFGFWPKRRWEHRIMIHEFAKHRRGVVKLQSAWRALLGRRAARHLRNLRALARAVLVLQKHRRGYLGRRRYARLAAEFRRQWKASTRIQAFGRGCAGRARVKRKLVLIAFRVATAAATTIQASYRAVVARRYVRIMSKHSQARKRRRLIASGNIQRIYRGYRGKKDYRKVLDTHNATVALRNRSAATIQRAHRCRAARFTVDEVRHRNEVRKKREHTMCVMLQARIRIIHTKNAVRRRTRVRAAKMVVAVFLQSCYRAKRDSIIVYVAAAEKRNKEEKVAAATIQRAQRTRVAKREMRHRLAVQRARERREWDASITIERASRGHLGRQRAIRKLEERLEFERKMAAMEVWAATLVEAGWRGHCGRVRTVSVRDERRARWKEMFDEDSQRPFFYNQITGEIRWRRPQDLLELMKRPTCGNCEYFEAAIECSTCAEFFCNDCFGQVHYGGKRAAHPFRSLYDAYGRRIDYGDGDFDLDSMWPSEIVQDDVAGILLRISPHREPVETVGTWQRYADADAGASYYYNPVSGEGTYEPPKAVLEHQTLTAYQHAKQQSEQYAVLGSTAAHRPHAALGAAHHDTNLYSHLEYGAT